MAKTLLALTTLVFVLAAAVFATLWYTGSPAASPGGAPVSQEPSRPVVDGKLVRIPDIPLTVSVPSAFHAQQERQMNLTTNTPYAVSFSIQNYVENPTSVQEPYQLYGIYQWDTGTISEEQFRRADFMLDPQSRQILSVGGRLAVKGVTRGERPRYSVFILHKGRILSLAADGASPKHRQVTDAIVQSADFGV